MHKRSNALHLVLGSAAITCGAVLACAWPGATHADDMYAAIEQQQEQEDMLFRYATKHGALRATTRLVQDEQVKSRWYLEVLVKNRSREGAETAAIEACIERTRYNPMSRGAPPPEVVWKTSEDVEVGPGEMVVRRHRLPRNLGWRVRRAQEMSTTPPKVMPRVAEAYGSSIIAMHPPSIDVPQA